MTDDAAILGPKHRRAIIYAFFFLVSLVGGVWLLVALRSMILPVVLGALLAYLFRPVIHSFRYSWLPEPIRIVTLLVGFIVIILSTTWVIKRSIPSDYEKTELLVRIQYHLNNKVPRLLGLNKPSGSFLNSTIKKEIQPILRSTNSFLTLSPQQRKIYTSSFKQLDSATADQIRYYHYFLILQKNEFYQPPSPTRSPTSQASTQEKLAAASTDSLLPQAVGVVSTWLVLPLVFLFLLFDNGNITHSIVRLIPNRYFELTLNLFHEVDRAIGNYLRGTFLQCSLVGASLALGLLLIGIPWNHSLLIAFISGLANAIPFLGPLVGLAVGLSYALIAESISPWLPMVDLTNIVFSIIVVVGLTQLLDNAVFQPVVLGSAVQLHPLVVVFGVMGGSMLFGFAGMLLAVPTIVIIKVVVTSFLRGLRAYAII